MTTLRTLPNGQELTTVGVLLASTLLPASDNVTDAGPDPDDADVHVRVTRMVLAFVCIGLIIVAIGGNVVVICAILHTPYLRRLNNYLIVSLSLADLGSAIFCMPFFVMELFNNYRWPLSHALCALYAAIEISFGLLSVFTLAAISCERVFLITKPMVYQRLVTEPRLIGFIVMLWLVCFTYGFLQMIWFYTSSYQQWALENPGKCRYLPSREFTIFAFMIAFVLPLGVMLAAYMKIFCVVRGQIQRIRPRIHSVITEDGLSEEYSTLNTDKARSDRIHSIAGLPAMRSLENCFERRTETKEAPATAEPLIIQDDLGEDVLQIIKCSDSAEKGDNTKGAKFPEGVPDTNTNISIECGFNDTATLSNVGDSLQCNTSPVQSNSTGPCSQGTTSNAGETGQDPARYRLDADSVIETACSRHGTPHPPHSTTAVTGDGLAEETMLGSGGGVKITVESPRDDHTPTSSNGHVDQDSSTQHDGKAGSKCTRTAEDLGLVKIDTGSTSSCNSSNPKGNAAEEAVFNFQAKEQLPDEVDSKHSGDRFDTSSFQSCTDISQGKVDSTADVIIRNTDEEQSHFGSQIHSPTLIVQENAKSTCTSIGSSASGSRKYSICQNRSITPNSCILKNKARSSICSSDSDVQRTMQIDVSPALLSNSTSFDKETGEREEKNNCTDQIEKGLGMNSAVTGHDGAINNNRKEVDKLSVHLPERRARASSCNLMIENTTDSTLCPLRKASSASELPLLDKLCGVKTEPFRLHSVLKKPKSAKRMEAYPLHQKRNSVQFKLYDDVVLEPATKQALRAVLVDDETTGSSEGNTTETSLSSTHPQKTQAHHQSSVDDAEDSASLANTPSHRHTLQWARRHFNVSQTTFMTSTTSLSTHMSDAGMSSRWSRRRHRLFENKAVRMTSYVIGAFVVCWVPYQICMMLRLFSPNLVPDVLWNITTVVMFTSTAVNPFIYNFYSSQFRAATRKLLKCQTNFVHPE